MSLETLLSLKSKRDTVKQGMSEERIKQKMSEIRNLISFFREYPDLFIDFIKGENSKFKFYFYQRVFLRIAMRHRYVYAVFPRGYSKSFLSIMILMIRCVLYPRSSIICNNRSVKNRRQV